jgi:hypothetical protein
MPRPRAHFISLLRNRPWIGPARRDHASLRHALRAGLVHQRIALIPVRRGQNDPAFPIPRRRPERPAHLLAPQRRDHILWLIPRLAGHDQSPRAMPRKGRDAQKAHAFTARSTA